jgi:folylpolyglutamate synthase/dihydropteroate synthase
MQYADEHVGGQDVILVTGSFYTVGPALQEWNRKWGGP